MKATKIVYWVSTGILAFMMSYSAYAYLSQPAMDQAFQHLGYPAYFRIELAIAKLIGVVLLVAPVGVRVKEWVYAGFGIVFISAFISHLASGDPASVAVMPLVFFVLLVVSYVMLHRHQGKGTEQISLRRSIA
ncbi:MAG TPA: DoxX family protein [Chitinophagaceae bacterium]|nr:DoxX family protein [Chitinophagaceae bacterium]